MTGQFDAFLKYISSFLTVPPQEWLYMVKLLRIRHLRKDEYFFKQGETFDEIGFIIKGLLHNYYTTEDQKHLVKHFIHEGKPVTCYADLLLGRPASFSSQALEPTTLITLKYNDLKQLYKRHVCWEMMGRISAEKLFIEREEIQYMFLSMTAQERYRHFVEKNPELANRVPQYLIASYIGISAISLSRIRKSNTLPKSK